MNDDYAKWEYLMNLTDFIRGIPKAELHIHIEGTFEPELACALAQRNNVLLPYKTSDELKKAYKFKNLQDFLSLYYVQLSVLQTERDFYDLTMAYLKKARENGVLYVEISFDPQAHTRRGIAFKTVINGITKALADGHKQFGISGKLVMCLLRDMPEADAFKTLEQALPYKNHIIAIGLDSSEIDNPPKKFVAVFEAVRKYGFFVTIHAGENGPAAYIEQALELLHANRIDHGNSALEDLNLVKKLVDKQVPLTVCPLSNLCLCVVKDLEHHPLKKMIDLGLLVSVNSDDPPFFGGYLVDNYFAVAQALNLSQEDIVKLAKNSFVSSFLPESEKQKLIARVYTYAAKCT